MSTVGARREPAPQARIETARMLLHLPDPSEAHHVVDYFVRNEKHLTRWEPARPSGFYTAEWWAQQLERNRRELVEGRSLRLFVRSRRSPRGAVIGTCNFTNIVRGAFQACNLGYSIDATHEGKGMMREALDAAIDYVWEELRLHRIMANYQPTNERSGALLRRLGFAVEGYARDYLFIDGAWRDHVLTALTNPEGPTLDGRPRRT